jgi:uncharacterized LabA/DUF88 family protein
MVRAMIFIDGTWLGYVKKVLEEKLQSRDLEVYKALPLILTKKLKDYLQVSEVDLVRINFFASIPVNVDPRDKEEVEEQRRFYERLHKDFGYETEIYEINFKGRRLHKEDRDPSDSFIPEEKCVDVGLSVSMVYYATINAYDVAIVVIGDQDYVPALQFIRKLGKRVMIASVHGSCAHFYDPAKDPDDTKRIRDIETVFLDEAIETESPTEISKSRIAHKYIVKIRPL